MLGWVFLSALQTFLSVWECDIRVNTCAKRHRVCEALLFFFYILVITILRKFKERLREFSWPAQSEAEEGIFNINKDTQSNLIGHVVPLRCHTYLQ